MLDEGCQGAVGVLPTSMDGGRPGGTLGEVSGGLAFADDLMLDFGQQAGVGGSDPLGYNDPLMIQDLQSLPWYAWNQEGG